MAVFSVLNSVCRKLVFRHLANLRVGRLRLEDAQGEFDFGAAANKLSQQAAHLHVRDARFYRRVVFGGDLGFAESYIDGDFDSRDLTELLRFFSRNTQTSNRFSGGLATLRQFASRWLHWLRRNTRANSRKNIGAHYDLSNEFFSLFLDDTRNYSSGVFEHIGDSMEQASQRKMDLMCRKADIEPSDHVLEIGTGWGGLAEWAAQRFGCRVTTTTISREQHAFAKERMARASLQDRVELLTEDYRDLTGRYDHILSVEMIEAVGHQFLGGFFAKCAELLTEDGNLCMQAITIADHRYTSYLKSVDFIRTHIFPGGCLPSVSALTTHAAENGFHLVQLEDYGGHYAETLRRWRVRFEENREQIAALGFDERFQRMWEYYLRYCEAGFEEGQVGLVQLVFSKTVPQPRSAQSGEEWKPRDESREAVALCHSEGAKATEESR